jgi:hypothetical protein
LCPECIRELVAAASRGSRPSFGGYDAMSTGYLVWKWGLLLAALVVLPFAYACVLIWLHRAAVTRPPRLEFFVAFGTLGGWLLTWALSPSPLSLPCAAFCLLVSLPASLFFIFRLAAQHDRRERPHRYALLALCCGILVPGLVTALAFALDPR